MLPRKDQARGHVRERDIGSAGNRPARRKFWPPKELDAVTSQLRVWSAWYSSDTDDLSGIYGGDIAGNPADAPGLFNPLREDWRGRVGRTLARWFWGTRTPETERRTKLHLPVARDIAGNSAAETDIPNRLTGRV